MTGTIECFKVHLSEADIFGLADSYAEPLLEDSDCDEQGVFVWVSILVPSSEPPAATPQANPRRPLSPFEAFVLAAFFVFAVALMGLEMFR